MPSPTPKQVLERTNTIISAWESGAPGKSFGGMTLAQAKSKVKPSLDLRNEIIVLENQIITKKNQRDDADRETMRVLDLVVAGVRGDPTEGSDGSLIEAMGYIRKSERDSGLTRRRNGNGGTEQASA